MKKATFLFSYRLIFTFLTLLLVLLINPDQLMAVSTLFIDKAISERLMAAGACNSDEVDPILCSVWQNNPQKNLSQSPIQAIEGYTTNRMEQILIPTCFDQFKKTNITPPFFAQTINLITPFGACQIDLPQAMPGKKFTAVITIEMKGSPAANFAKTYTSSTSENESNDNINVKYRVNSQRHYLFSFNRNSWRFTLSPTKDDYWIGEVDAPFDLSMEGQDDYQNRLIDFNQTNNRGIRIDLNKSSWKVKQSGNLVGQIKGRWSKNLLDQQFSYTTDELDFCPRGCSITVTEELDVKAAKNNSLDKDGIIGNLSSKASHSEIYFGKGYGLKDSKGLHTGGVAWSELVVTKKDNRSWNQNLEYFSKDPLDFAYSIFDASQKSSAQIWPMSNQLSAETTYKKTFYINEKAPGSGGRLEKAIDINRTDINQNNKITRSGGGTFVTKKPFNMGIEEITGEFDSQNEFLRVIAPKNLENSRIDPYDPLRLNPRYYQTYLPEGTIYLPGLFTATSDNVNKTSISSLPYKAIPKKVILIKSFINYDSVLTQKKVTLIEDFVRQMEQRGAQTEIVIASDRKSLLNTLQSAPDGAMIIHLSNSISDQYLLAGKDKVSFLHIQKAIKEKQLHLSTFAGSAGFIGVMTPIAEEMIVSQSATDFKAVDGSLGSLFKNNYWKLSVSDMQKGLSDTVNNTK